MSFRKCQHCREWVNENHDCAEVQRMREIVQQAYDEINRKRDWAFLQYLDELDQIKELERLWRL